MNFTIKTRRPKAIEVAGRTLVKTSRTSAPRNHNTAWTRAAVFIRLGLSLGMLCLLGSRTESHGQQLREVFHSVQQAVVVVRTVQQGLAPFPEQGLVSSNGLGSGVLIFNDGKVLTAAHLVQSADKTLVEFSEGELIPARVIGTSVSADVALLQLERSPGNYAAAKLGNSDLMDVGDEVFVVGAPYGKWLRNIYNETKSQSRLFSNSQTVGSQTKSGRPNNSLEPAASH